MQQQTLASQASFEKYGRKTRRELFLEEMNQVVPWSELEALVEPHYPKAGNGRRPVGLGIMLRTYFVQQWFNLSDPGVEEALYDSTSLRRFVGVDLGVAPAPDQTSVCRFRHLLEKHELGGAMLDAVNHHLDSKGIRITTGTIVDATIIHAPSSTKNSTGERDPVMHQTRKGKQSYFGLKAHIGVDSKEGVVHSVCASAASVADVPMLPDLLHGEERKVWGDGGYQGQTEVIRQAAPHAQDMTCRRTRFRNYVDEEARRKNTTKSRWRWWMYRRAKSHRLTGALGRRTCCGHGRWRDSIATRRLLPHAEIADKLLAMNALSVGAKKSSSEAHQMLLDIQSKLAVKQFN